MPHEPLPKVGVFCASVVDADLEFALRSIELNTEHPDFEMLVGVAPPMDGRDPRPTLENLKDRYRFFDYVWYGRGGDGAGIAGGHERLRGLNSPSPMLEDLHQRLAAKGCTRFFQINDDVAVTRYWLHYAEDAMRRMGGDAVVTPHDGMVNTGANADGSAASSGFCGFYYYSDEYVRRHHAWGTAFRAEPVQCYWVDTEFCVRAAKLGRLVREPACCVLHLHNTNLPRTLCDPRPLRAVRASCARDGLLFIDRMREEGIDPWKHIPDLARWTPEDILDEMESLRGIESAGAETRPRAA